MKKKYILILLMLCLVLVGCKSKKDNKKEDSKSDIEVSYDLSGDYELFKSFNAFGKDYNIDDYEYCLYDIDKDGKLDLILKEGNDYYPFRIKDGKVQTFKNSVMGDVKELRIYKGDIAGIITDESKDDDMMNGSNIIVFYYDEETESILSNGKKADNFTEDKFNDKSTLLELKRTNEKSDSKDESETKSNIVLNTLYIDACENKYKNEANQCISNKSIEEQIKPFEVDDYLGYKYTSSGSIPYFIFKDDKVVDFNECFGEGCALIRGTYKVSNEDGKTYVTITVDNGDGGTLSYIFEQQGKKLVCVDEFGVWLSTNEFIPYEK